MFFILINNNWLQRWQYEKLGILKHQSFNLLRCLFIIKNVHITTICPIFYIACYMLAILISLLFFEL